MRRQPSREEKGIGAGLDLLTFTLPSEEGRGRALKALAAVLSRDPGSVTGASAPDEESRGNYSIALLCRDWEHAAQIINGKDRELLMAARRPPQEKPVGFLFPGLGEDFPGMGGSLYRREPVFRHCFENCSQILERRCRLDIRQTLTLAEETPGDESTARAPGGDVQFLLKSPLPKPAAPLAPSLAHPLLFSIEYSLAQLWDSWGVRPQVVLGYSLGEYVAACLAGVFSLEDALTLVAQRARLLEAQPSGRCLAVALSESELAPMLARTGVSLAASNGRRACVVAGPADRVRLLQSLWDEDVAFRPIPVAHAFHSAELASLEQPLAEMVSSTRRNGLKIPLLSTVTGAFATDAELRSTGHWARHVSGTVRFHQAIQHLAGDQQVILLELGPGRTLSSLALQALGLNRLAVSSMPGARERQDEVGSTLRALARLWLGGVSVEWSAFHKRREG